MMIVLHYLRMAIERISVFTNIFAPYLPTIHIVDWALFFIRCIITTRAEMIHQFYGHKMGTIIKFNNE